MHVIPKPPLWSGFREAKFGLFIHYGLYTPLGKGEWVQYHDRIPVVEYEKLMHDFRAEAFDADASADTAVDAGMHYINITTRQHDTFCLFDARETDSNMMNTRAHRGAEKCRSRTSVGHNVFCGLK